MAWTLGLHALRKASQYSCLCSTQRLFFDSRRTWLHGVKIIQQYRVSKRWKSSAAILTTKGMQNGDDDRVDRKVQKELPTNGVQSGNEDRKGWKDTTSIKQEHNDTSVNSHKQKDTLLLIRRKEKDITSTIRYERKDTPSSIRYEQHRNVKSIQEEDLEYVEELGDQKPAKTELVGALPPGALDWRPQKIEIQKLGSYYMDLSKSRLTGLVVLTAVAGYAMAPAPLDPLTLIICAMGTGLTSSSANAINQFFEVPYDAQMNRTKNRILVRGLITPLHAVCFGGVCGATGIGLLYFGANGVAASLAAANLFLYTCSYTPLKRITILNTWVGAVVGAIPPLIGWASCTGELEAGAWIMAGLLYAWQFPHFNSLSWNLRPDYSRAGYRMMSVTNPGLCRRVALRYSVAMIGLCTLAPIIDVTTWTFAADSLPLNIYLSYLAWRFYKDADSKSSRKLFLFTLIHLPAIMILIIISKKHYNKKKLETGTTGVIEEKGTSSTNTGNVLNNAS